MSNLIFFFLIFSLTAISAAHAQVNVQLLHQLVEESKSEYSRQNQARDRQMLNTATEEVNRSQMSRLKTKYRQLQSRFHSLGLAIDAAQIGIQASPIVAEIIQQQSLILEQAREDPMLIALAIQVEHDLAGKAHALINYLYGLAISIGDLGQMKSSDRRILLGHVLTELRGIAGASRGLASAMKYSSSKKALQQLNPFADFINEDKQLVNSIIDKLKQF